MDKVIAELAELNKKVDVIVGIMQKPENRFGRILETVAAIAGALSILGIIDVIRNWILGS